MVSSLNPSWWSLQDQLTHRLEARQRVDDPTDLPGVKLSERTGLGGADVRGQLAAFVVVETDVAAESEDRGELLRCRLRSGALSGRPSRRVTHGALRRSRAADRAARSVG